MPLLVFFQVLRPQTVKPQTIGRLSSYFIFLLIIQPPSFLPFFLVKFRLLSSLQTLLLVTVLKYLFVGWRWVVAVRRRWRIGAHHHMCRSRLCRVCWVCHNPWVACHPIDPEALHTSWLLGNWKEETHLSLASLAPSL